MRFYTVALLLQSVSFSVANLAHYQLSDIQDSQKRFSCYDQIFDYNGLRDDQQNAYARLRQDLLSEITIPEIEAKLGNLRYGSKVMYKSSVPNSRYYQFSTEGDGDSNYFYTYILIIDSHGHISAVLGRITTVQSVAPSLRISETFCTII
ncbi:CSEP0067 putative effector protein [Blumeria hordei DH14]|uniref:CSEP0067 putative effector protein n=1 Tax=Blumeria graminis f. sp. hordei (strain DH14) TaxID=546991 RepID=N1JC15_BLUG1|nr:CSEP0067 putative effector protein [Blumeria hordei DH14]